MKTETITLTTTKSIGEIADILRKAASKLRANLSQTDMSVFGNVCVQPGDISVALSGSNSILGGPRKWEVQVQVIDEGLKRKVQLIAVGDHFADKLSNGSFGNPFFELRDSVGRMNTIAEMLKR